MMNNIDVDKIASLSGLALNESERDELTLEVKRLISFASAIADTKVDTSIAEIDFSADPPTREDIPKNGMERKTLLNSCPSSTSDGYIRVPSAMKKIGRRENE